METKFGKRPNAVVFIPGLQSQAAAAELRDFSPQPGPDLLPARGRENVLQLKLQQRRSREELVKQGIMPPLKSSTSFHEQRRSLERARTEDYLKRKIRSRPERSELIRMHILEETLAEPSLQAKQLQLKRARIADDLNDKISQRPGPMELIHKNILPVHSSIKQAIKETRFPKASGGNSSCDEDSSYSLSPDQSIKQESPLGLLPPPSPAETLARSFIPSPAQVLPPVPPLPSISGSSPSLNGVAAASPQRACAVSQIKYQLKPNSDRAVQRHKKVKDNKPKIKKLKYHQYIPPDQKGDKEPPPHLDSSYAKILQQQQLFLQLQILNQQQQQCNYHAILPAPPTSQTDQQTSSSSPSRPVAAPPSAPSNQGTHSCQRSASLSGPKPASLPPNLEEMKVAELKSELKLRSLPVSGTKNDLIERLRTYQELNGGSGTTSTPTAGGTTGPGAEGAGKSSKTAATTTTTTNPSQQQQQFQCYQTSPTSQSGSSVAPAEAAPQQPMTCGGTVSPPPVSLTPSGRSSHAMSPEDTSFNSGRSEEMLCLQPCSDALLTIKEEPKCSTPAPCQFFIKTASLQKYHVVSSTAPTSKSPVDKDKMLQEKDKQIEELTRMLLQKQRLVEVLRRQLEHGKSGGRVPEPPPLIRVKQEPLDKPGFPLSFDHPPLPRPPSSVSCEMKVTVKQEATEKEDVLSEMQSPDTHGLPQSLRQTQEASMKSELTSAKIKQQQKHICLQQTTLQFAQQQAIQKVLQQCNIQNQQRIIQNRSQTPDNQQRRKRADKQQLKRQQQQQQMQLRQQILLKQQKSVLQQQNKQQQQIHMQTKIHLKQQQVLVQQPPQVSQTNLNQQSASAPSLPLDLLNSNSTPTLVTDSNGNHFLITLTSHITENQRTDAPESQAADQIPLQRLQSTPAKLAGHDPVQLPKADGQTKPSAHVGFSKQQKITKGGLQVCEPGLLQASPCLSAPPSLQPFFKGQEAAPSGKNTASPSTQIEMCPSLDVLFSPLSPASVKTAASSPDDKDTQHEDDFIDIILQTGDMSSAFKPAPDSYLDPNSSASPPSPLQQLLSGCDTPHSAPSVQEEEKQHLCNAGSGRLEDFLESTTGKPLLGVEPGGLLTLIDDLHSQMLCTPSILYHPPSPMDTSDMAVEGEHGLDSMDWLDLTMGEERGEETPTLAPLCPPTPPSVFSTDFLDSYDLQIHWDSCL